MKQVAPFLIMSTFSALSHADIVELTGGFGAWRADFSGDVGQYGQTTNLDNLGISGHNNNQLWFQLEHATPMLPNFRVMFSHISVREVSRVKQEIVIGDLFVRGDINIDVLTDLNLSHGDITAYYEFVDNILEIDLGASLRYFQGYVEIETEINAPYRWELSGTVPMLFGRAQLNIPGSGISIESFLNAMSYDDNTIVDYSASLKWLSGAWGLSAGYREMYLDINDFNGFTADSKASGPYAEFLFKF